LQTVAKTRVTPRDPSAPATACVLCSRAIDAGAPAFIAKGKRTLCSTCVDSVAVAAALLGAAGGGKATAAAATHTTHADGTSTPTFVSPTPPTATLPPGTAAPPAGAAAQVQARTGSSGSGKAGGSGRKPALAGGVLPKAVEDDLEAEIFGNYAKGEKPPKPAPKAAPPPPPPSAPEEDEAAPVAAASSDDASAGTEPNAVPAAPAAEAAASPPAPTAAALLDPADENLTEILGLPAPAPERPVKATAATATAAAAESNSSTSSSTKRSATPSGTPGAGGRPRGSNGTPLPKVLEEEDESIFASFEATKPKAARRKAPAARTESPALTPQPSTEAATAAPESGASASESEAKPAAPAKRKDAAAPPPPSSTAAAVRVPSPPPSVAVPAEPRSPLVPPARVEPATAEPDKGAPVPSLITNPSVAAFLERATTTVYESDQVIVRRQQELRVLLEDLEETIRTTGGSGTARSSRRAGRWGEGLGNSPRRSTCLGGAASAVSDIVISALREKEVALLIEWNHLMAEKDRLLRLSHGLQVPPTSDQLPTSTSRA